MKKNNYNFNGNKLKIIDDFLSKDDYQSLLNLDIRNKINKKIYFSIKFFNLPTT